MAVALPVIGETRAGGEAAPAWRDFERRRDAVVEAMEMATCDNCDGCGTRCTDGFGVSRAEYEAVRAYLAAVPPEERARVLGQDKTAPWPGAEETGVTFTFCRYRDREKNNCFIYPVRPTVCRLFGHTHWLPCPIGAVRRVPPGSPELWDGYTAFERRTWEAWDEAEKVAINK